MDVNSVNWSNLPEELLPEIGKRLLTNVDVLRFRSVCESWRSSLPPLPHIFPPFPLHFPFPVNSFLPRPDVFLSLNVIYRLENLDHSPIPYFPSSSFSSSSESTSSSTCNNGVLLKVEESEPGKFRLLHPLFKRQIRYNLEAFPKVLNLLDCRIFELSKSYSLKLSPGVCVPGVTKVVMFPNSAWTNYMKDSVVVALFNEGKLGFVRHGDEKWILIDDRNFYYDDVIVYKGQFYVVDRWGTVSWIDSGLGLIQFSPPLFGFGSQKHLVESCGELYVVDRFLDKERRFWNQNENHNLPHHFVLPFRRFDDSQGKAVDFKVYKLDQEWGRWVEVKNLGDTAFILATDCCFSVLAKDFSGCKGNCIYYTDQTEDEAEVRGATNYGFHSRVFDLEERKIGKIASLPGYSQIFWPHPTWTNY